MTKPLKINDIFYTLQGEGELSGRACWFIRFQGCNLKCPFCDTPKAIGKRTDLTLSPEEVAEKIPLNARRVVITGGEPLAQLDGLHYLLKALHQRGLFVQIETNGTLPFPYSSFNFPWFTISPKGESLNPGTLLKASELKFLVGIPKWQSIIRETLKQVHRTDAALTLMPLDTKDDLQNKRNLTLAINYALRDQRFTVRPQMHKLWRIP